MIVTHNNFSFDWTAGQAYLSGLPRKRKTDV